MSCWGDELLSAPACNLAACCLPGGGLFVAGGAQYNDTYNNSLNDYNDKTELVGKAHMFSLATCAWIETTSLPDAHGKTTCPTEAACIQKSAGSPQEGDRHTPILFGASAVGLPSGRLLVIGGLAEYCCGGKIGRRAHVHASTCVSEYNPATNVWRDLTPMSGGRASFAAHLLPDGRVLVAGGYSGACPLLMKSALDAEACLNSGTMEWYGPGGLNVEYTADGTPAPPQGPSVMTELQIWNSDGKCGRLSVLLDTAEVYGENTSNLRFACDPSIESISDFF